MHTIVFVDWSIEAKTAQVTHESGIFDGFVPTIMQWCDGDEKNDENNCFDPSRGKKLSFLRQNLMRNAVRGRSWHQVATKLAQVEPKLAQVSPKLALVGPKLSQVSSKLAQVEPKLTEVGAKLAQRWPMLSQECTTADISKTCEKPVENNDGSRFPCLIWAQDGTG